METWSPIPQCPGYHISDHGNVTVAWERVIVYGGSIRKPSESPVPVKQHVNVRKYHYVRLLTEDGSYRNFQVHRLVLAAFVGECPPGGEGCHKDGSRTNNHVDNLYWGSRSDNCMDTSRHGRNRNAKLTPEQIQEAIKLHGSGMILADIATRFGVHPCSLSRRMRRHGYRPFDTRWGKPAW